MRLAGMLLLALCFSGFAAQAPKEKKAPAKKSAAKAAPQQKKLVVPDGAVQVAPGRWRWVDKRGQAWIYWNSLFGVVRYEATENDPKTPLAPRPKKSVRAFDEGDAVRFEESMPMGVNTWHRKKAELSDAERLIWERDAPKPEGQGQAPAEAPKQEAPKQEAPKQE